MRVRRIADVSQLDAEERAGNALKKTVLEYAVRGHFMMSKNDKFGRHARIKKATGPEGRSTKCPPTALELPSA